MRTRYELLRELEMLMRSLAAAKLPRPRTRFECSYCHSVDVKVLPLVVSEGTSTIAARTSSAGIGIAGGSVAIGSAISSTRGTQRSTLAALVAPPKPTKPDENPGKIGCLLGTTVTVFIAWGVGSFWLFLGGGLATLILSLFLHAKEEATAKENDKSTYIPAHVKWQRSFICLRCMRITDPDA